MKIYRVGGSVRDQLLGHPHKERDWVVVGATPQQMLDLGYRLVGKDFPVFLHPTTHEEYALARTERKTAPGYKGFDCYAAPDVTLEEDLQRRDLTINAMALTEEGEIIDPYGGQKDLAAHVLHHVSPAFVEDPVRILRVARFSARLGDFSIHPDTLQLMQAMVHSGEVNALVAERVWQEWERALKEPHSERFFEVLSQVGALSVLFPEFSENEFGFAALERAVARDLSAVIRFAVLFWALGTNKIHAICQRYRISKDYRDLALLVQSEYPHYLKADALDAVQCLVLLNHLDVFRRSERLDLFLVACEVIADVSAISKKSQVLRTAYAAAKVVQVRDLVSKSLSGEAIRKAVQERRIEAILNGEKT